MTLFVLPDVVKVHKPIERKICGCGIVNLLTKSDMMLQEPYVSALWSKALFSLLSLLELPATIEKEEPDELYTLDIEDGGYQTSFTKLASSTPLPEDPAAGLSTSDVYLAQQLVAMSPEKRNIAKSLLSTSQEASQCLPKYFQQANISLDQL
jgi:exportin-2 (importin alpha re-exporter)